VWALVEEHGTYVLMQVFEIINKKLLLDKWVSSVY
jgi:hypothetical protein